MKLDFRALLWLLKLGAGMNLFLIASLLAVGTPNPQVVVPGLILLGVSGFRCLFPNRYLDNIVFHDTPLNVRKIPRLILTQRFIVTGLIQTLYGGDG